MTYRVKCAINLGILSSDSESKYTSYLFSNSQILAEKNILSCCLSVDFFAKKADRYFFRKEEWEKLLSKRDGVEITKFKVRSGYPGSGQRYFLRLGTKQDGYCKTAIVQVNNDVFDPPRGGNIYNMRRTLRHKTRQVIHYNPCDGPL